MLKSLEAIEAWRRGEAPGEAVPWLRYIAAAERPVVNLERVESLQLLEEQNPVLDYVERSLRLLDGLPLSYWIKELAEETLIWSETAKGGSRRERKRWQRERINSFAHNIGSAELYRRHVLGWPDHGASGDGAAADGRAAGAVAVRPEPPQRSAEQAARTAKRASGPAGELAGRERIIHRLIETHGLIGQQIRGEVPPEVNRPLGFLAEEGLLAPEELERLLAALNHCIIAAVSPELWLQVQPEAQRLIAAAANGGIQPMPLEERLRRMRTGPGVRGEDFAAEWERLAAEGFVPGRLALLSSATFWYAESALQTFSLEQFLKVMLLIAGDAEMTAGLESSQISFAAVMNSIYYDYQGVKKINVYKKRIIEKYLSGLGWEDAAAGGTAAQSPHLAHRLRRQAELPDTLFFDFVFSPAAEKLIEFCIEAEKSPLYERAVLMLFDLFGLRRDAFDRFHNEDSYLSQMNGTADYKALILDYIAGTKVLDIGPGGGVLLDLIEERLPDAAAVGIDISSNVIEALQQRKAREGRRWEVLQGDALNLKELVDPGSVDTVVFSSILHELYSYVPYNGKKFNHATVAAALTSAYEVLAEGGVIIIRDGIMTEPEDELRRVRFLEEDGMAWLERYAADFAGRIIRFEKVGPQEVKMPVNDAMEFLYTYTWGPEAYVHEVQEQFGYFTPGRYKAFIHSLLGDTAVIEVFRHYLQAGYTEALEQRVSVMNEQGEPVALPDSTCFIVIRKGQAPQG